MKHCLLWFFALFLSHHYCTAQSRPNIIVFMVDDLGWMDTSAPFADSIFSQNKKFHTPNMERLAQEGMIFTNAYAAPVCTPSRISMLTGLNAAHHGVTNWTATRKDVSTDAGDSQFSTAPWNINGLSTELGIERAVYATPFPELLKESGYFTIHVGKAHWGPAGTPGANPYNMGFMINISGHSAGHPQSYLSEENYGNITGKAMPQAVPDLEEYFGTGTFLTEALTLEALKALEAPIKRKQPFFLNMAHYAVHVPIAADKRFVQKYLDEGLGKIEAAYASMVEGMDKSLGDIMDYLREHQLENNTIIIFTSDNGGLSLAPPRGGVEHTQNLPLRAGKGSIYEGGIRVPLIVKWPEVTHPGAVTAHYVIIEDIFPTILDMAGITVYNSLQTADGISFVPFLKGVGFADTSRVLIWHYPNKWKPHDGPGINYRSAIRQGRWKLIYNMRDGSKELYNLKEDIGEQHNLAVEFPKKVRALSHLLGSKLREWHAPMPVMRSTGEKAPFPDENWSNGDSSAIISLSLFIYKPVNVPLCVTYNLENGSIKEARIYMLGQVMMQQIQG